MVYFIGGFFIGIVVTGVLFVFLMRNYMIVYYKIPGNFEEVNEKVKKTIPEFNGWSFPIQPWEFYKSQISKGFKYKNIKNMVIHFVCKSAHANVILNKRPEFGGIMPCSWAVYEMTNGDVYIAKMNINMLSKMFTGTIRNIMQDVAETEKKMLEKIR